MTQTCFNTLDLLNRALGLMDSAGMHAVAAQIAMAMDQLERDPSCGEMPVLF